MTDEDPSASLTQPKTTAAIPCPQKFSPKLLPSKKNLLIPLVYFKGLFLACNTTFILYFLLLYFFINLFFFIHFYATLLPFIFGTLQKFLPYLPCMSNAHPPQKNSILKAHYKRTRKYVMFFSLLFFVSKISPILFSFAKIYHIIIQSIPPPKNRAFFRRHHYFRISIIFWTFSPDLSDEKKKNKEITTNK
jgi:hypothetical protein